MRLTSAAYFHLKQADFSKHTRNLSPASRAILLSGPTGMLSWSYGSTIHASFILIRTNDFYFFLVLSEELYRQMLAKALAHSFDAKLLLLDVTEFTLRVCVLSNINI